MIPAEELVGLRDGFLEVLVPRLLAELIETAAADVVLVGLFAPGMVTQFEDGNQVAVDEERRAEACAQGEHQFNAVALDGPIAGHTGVVGHADWLLPALFQLRRERDLLRPQRVQIPALIDYAVLDHSGKADGDAIEFSFDQLAQLVETGEHRSRRSRDRGNNPLPLAHRLALGIEQHGL